MAHWLPAGTVELGRLGTRPQVAHSATIAALRPTFVQLVVNVGLADFDASAQQNSEPRELTPRVSRAIYEMTTEDHAPAFDGVRFLSRHGSDLELWSIFERSTDGTCSAQLSDIVVGELRPEHPDVLAARRLHALSWG